MKILLGTTIGIFLLLNKRILVFTSNSVCYDQLGCFDNGYPWNSPSRIHVPLPASPTDINTKFLVFPSSRGSYINLTTWPHINFDGIPFNSTWETVFITHGFSGKVLGSWPEEMSRAFASKEYFNVLAVDWSKGASLSSNLSYLSAVSNTRVVGAEVSRVIKYIVSNLKVSRADIHLIGHSLGAQVCSYASNGVEGVFRITGLDSAQPYFENEIAYDKRIYLDKSDACIVEGIHTDAKTFIPLLGFGFIASYGDVDHYVNGGSEQPGCFPEVPVSENETVYSVVTSARMIHLPFTCSHTRAHQYYFETILNNSCIMWGHKNDSMRTNEKGMSSESSTGCDLDTCTPIGANSSEYPAQGVFLSRTHDKPQFCVLEPTSNYNMALDMKTMQRKSKRNVCDAKKIHIE